MNLESLIHELHGKGVVLSLEDHGNIGVTGPKAAITPEILGIIRELKNPIDMTLRTPAETARREWSPEWLQVLRLQDNHGNLGFVRFVGFVHQNGGGSVSTSNASWPNPSDPMAPAHKRYQGAVEEVGRIWDSQVATGAPAPWLDPAVEDRLDEDIAARFRARDLPGALAGIEAWRAAWMAILVPGEIPQDGTRDSNTSSAAGCVARRLDGPRLAELADDPDVPAEDRRIYRAELDQRGQAILDESEGRIPHPNQGVHNMFDRKAGGFVDCSRHRHWISTSGVQICGICHPPAYPGLVREWIEPEDQDHRHPQSRGPP